MAHSKRSRSVGERSAWAQSRAAGGDSEPGPDIYALVLHGIGVPNAERLVKTAVRNIARYIEMDGWAEHECGGNCRFDPGHVHLTGTSGEKSSRLVIDPYYWGQLVPARNIFIVTWWALRAVFALGILQFATPVMRFANYVETCVERKGRLRIGPLAYALLLLALGPFILFFRIVVLLAVAAAGLTVLLICPPLWKHARDAFAWCSDDAFEKEVIRSCGEKVARSGGKRVMLIGHSQGGSILTEYVLAQSPQFKKSVFLITMGSGQALLATLRRARAVDSWAIVAIFFTALAYVMAAITLILPPALQLLSLLQSGLRGFGDFAAAIWLWPVLDQHAVVATVGQQSSGTIHEVLGSISSPSPSLPSWAYLVLPLLNAMMVVAVRYVVLPLGKEIAARTRPSVPGVDVVSSRDLVASALKALGSKKRVVFVRQASSFVLDHVIYYRNGISALPQIAAGLDRLRGIATARLQKEALADSEREHAFRMGGTRVATMSSTLALGFLISAGLTSEAPLQGSLLLGSVAVGVVLAESGALWRLSEDSALARTDYWRAASILRRRRRSYIMAVLSLAVAAYCFGILVGVYGATIPSWVSESALASARKGTGPLGLATTLLGLDALLFLRGSRLARPLALAAWAALATTSFVFGVSLRDLTLIVLLAVGFVVCWPREKRGRSGTGVDASTVTKRVEPSLNG